MLAHAVAGAFDVADGTLIAQHGRRFGRDQLICDPRHYLPILERKPGALRSGTLFRQWDLPQSIQIVRDRILKQPKGDRAFVERLPMARDAGLEPLEVACDLVLDGNVVTASVVINAMRRLIAPMHPVTMSVPEMLKLEVEPLAVNRRSKRTPYRRPKGTPLIVGLIDVLAGSFGGPIGVSGPNPGQSLAVVRPPGGR